jgi:antibiotic biosynthesis monooxygenase (ABM) superfamily enzyme
MNKRERTLELLGIWLAVYPSVLLMSYVFEWLRLGWPMWAEIMFSTALTVPLISFVAVPKVRGAIATAENTTPSDLARREAQKVERKEGARAPGE